MMTDTIEPSKTEIETSSTNRYLLSNETYERLKQAQTRIREKTELVPSMRKIVTDILNERNLNLYIEHFIEKHGD